LSRARAAVAALAAAVLACSSPGPPPWEVLAPARMDELGVVVVLPIEAWPALLEERAEEGDLEPALRSLETALEAELDRRGLDTPGAGFGEALDALARERGVDLRPGHAAPVDLQRLRRDALAEVRSRTGADALLVPTLVQRPATLSGVHASWDGRSQDVTYRAPGEHNARLSRVYRGGTQAISLRVELLDAGGARIYLGHGGLHVLSRIDSYKQRIPVDTVEILSPERAARAVELALGGVPGGDED
jgi:hypothetical protein